MLYSERLGCRKKILANLLALGSISNLELPRGNHQPWGDGRDVARGGFNEGFEACMVDGPTSLVAQWSTFLVLFFLRCRFSTQKD